MNFKIIIAVFLIAAATLAVYGYKEYNRKQKDTAGMQSSFNISTVSLIQDFEADENTANKKYLDKVITVEGTVAKMEVSDSTQVVSLKGNSPMAFVNCQFESRYKAAISQLKVGGTVKVKGICTGMLMDVVLNRCVLIK